MTSPIGTTLFTALVLIGTANVAAPAAFASPAPIVTANTAGQTEARNFTKKKYKISGSWAISQRGDQTVISFSEDFKTKNGPDLKIFLSPKSVANVTGQTAVDGALMISVLQSNKGSQEYVLPAGVNIDDYKSVLVHCEKFAVLWGGGDL